MDLACNFDFFFIAAEIKNLETFREQAFGSKTTKFRKKGTHFMREENVIEFEPDRFLSDKT